jgi:hypothetical protein
MFRVLFIATSSYICRPCAHVLQPNDAGTNRALHGALAAGAKNLKLPLRSALAGKKILDLPTWNQLFVDVWGKFVEDEHALLKTGSNHITDGWRAVGLLHGDLVSFLRDPYSCLFVLPLS